MAKLKAPLLSLGASGQVGKALVFFPWKGLDAVREYVIPANPRTTAQTTHRAFLTDAVAAIHAYQGEAAYDFSEEDIASYALLGSLQPTPRTWFNTVVRQWINQKVAGLVPGVWGEGVITPGDGKLTVKIRAWPESGNITSNYIYYGTSKTALVNRITCTLAEILAGHDIPGLTNGVKYFVQVRTHNPVNARGCDSGIYYGTPSA